MAAAYTDRLCRLHKHHRGKGKEDGSCAIEAKVNDLLLLPLLHAGAGAGAAAALNMFFVSFQPVQPSFFMFVCLPVCKQRDGSLSLTDSVVHQASQRQMH